MKTMKNWKIRVLGVMVFGVLVVSSAKFCAPQIQASLTEKTTQALHLQGLNWARVHTNGMHVYLAGEAPTEAKREEAESIARAVWGPETITNNIQLAAAPDPYSFTASYDGEKLIINGHAGDEESIQHILDAPKPFIAENNVSHNLQLASGSPEFWVKTTSGLLKQLLTLEKGSIEVRNQQGTLKGSASNQADKAALKLVLAQFKDQQFTIHASLSAPPPPPTCQEKFNEALGAEKIIFANNQSSITSPSFPLLARLKKVSNQCPEAHISILGHTDSTGSNKANTELSSHRAQAVVEHLTRLGSDASKLTAVGKGESQPIVSNSTKEGRAKNRRIEFRILVPSTP